MGEVSTLFWQAGGLTPRPSSFRHSFKVRREIFDHGICTRTDYLELWLLDGRGIDALLKGWNAYPPSENGRGYHYSRVYGA